jgi:small subunit ribosomal protein S13
MMEREFKYIVRIANTDLDGRKAIGNALRKIRGVSFSFANAVCSASNVDKLKKAGELSEEEIKKIDGCVKTASNLPAWLLNRRKDIESGKDTHLITSQLQFVQEQDIRRMKKIRCYKGVRHAVGLPVRGQRTRSNFRKNKGKVLGVQRKGVKRGRV